MSGALAGLGMIAFMLFGVLQLAMGFAGIESGFGAVWAWLALIAALAFRFTLPITIGSFFGVMNVWGWHWIFAALFAAPGLAFVVPGVLASVFTSFKRR